MPDPAPAPVREPDPLDDQRITAVGLLVEAGAALVRVLDEELRRDVGMPLGTYETLIRLARSPDRRLRQVELSRQLSLTTGGVTRMIDRLESAGLVRRSRGTDDRRASYAELTADGLTAVRQATGAHLRSVQRHLVEPLGCAGLAALVAPLRRLRDIHSGDPAGRQEPITSAARSDAAAEPVGRPDTGREGPPEAWPSP